MTDSQQVFGLVPIHILSTCMAWSSASKEKTKSTHLCIFGLLDRHWKVMGTSGRTGQRSR